MLHRASLSKTTNILMSSVPSSNRESIGLNNHGHAFSLDGNLIDYDDEMLSDELPTEGFYSTVSSVTAASEASLRSSRSSLRRMSRPSELKPIGRSSILRAQMKSLDELTINKFDMESVGLIGREPETATIKGCCERMVMSGTKEDQPEDTETAASTDSAIMAASLVQSQTRKELIFVKGPSGVGKSSLAKTLEKYVTALEDSTFVEGKFDLNSVDVPYSGIAKAFGEICQKVKDASEIAESLSGALQGTVDILYHLIPELEDIVPSRTTATSTNPDSDIEYGHERFRNAFRTLTRALNRLFSPMVLVLDDLQWADVSSLEVIDFLIADLQNPNMLMIIGCYRSNEVDENSLLFNKIQTLDGKKAKFGFNITDIELKSCQINDVNKIIMGMLSIDDAHITRELAELCYKRTLGNPYFLIEFMILLQSEGLIFYNIGLLKWVWDVGKIADATMSTANVVELLQARIRKLPETVRLLLQYAACLGSSFRLRTLELIWKKHATMSTDFSNDTVATLIATVAEERIVESCGDQQFRWVHDKIQEAVLSHDEAVNSSFQFQIGTTLYYSLEEKELEGALFDVVDLINKGTKAKQRPEFALLNLRAAEKARSISAFHSAVNYVARGVKLLPDDKWIAHRTLTLKLYTVGAELELALGHVEAGEVYSNEVLNRGDCSTMETLPLKMAKARKLCTVDLKFDETIDFTLGLLKELGCKLVWTRSVAPVQAIATLLRTIKMAKKAPAPNVILERLGPMNDKRHQAVMNLLSRLCYACYSADIFLNVLGVCKTVEMTLKHGICDMSSVGFAGLGLLVVAVHQDFDTASNFARMALAIQSSTRSSRRAETIYVAHCYSLPWTQPLQTCALPYAEAYSDAMRMGHTDYAMWSLLANHVWLPYIMGKALGPMLEECPKILSQMEEVSQPEQALVLKMFWQMMLNLTSTSSNNDGKLEGDIFSVDKFRGKGAVHLGSVHLAEGELLVFTNIEAAADRAIKVGDKFEKLAPGIFLGMIEVFHRAVALYALARQTKKRKYKAPANKLSKKIEKWMNGGNPNVKYYHLLLSAEKAALSKNYDIAEERYKEAIILAARTGHLHHAGLCNERYADFLLKEVSNIDEAKYRAGEAIRFYEEWGVLGKVERLKKLL